MIVNVKFKKFFITTGKSYSRIFFFVLKLVFWFFLLVSITPIFASVFKNVISFSDFTLYITASFIIAYTYETQKMREQMEKTDLRPVILRAGYIENFESIKFKFDGEKIMAGKPLEFRVSKGIATDIEGSIVINHKKYKLLFGNDISKIGEGLMFLPKWGWVGENGTLFAIFKIEDGILSIGENELVLKYKDIEGGQYCTLESKDFSQKSFQL